MKKKWVIGLVIVSLLCGVLLSFLFRKEKVNTVVINHVSDSISYQKQYDSLSVIVDGLKKISESKGKEIVRLRGLLAANKDSVITLSPTETVSMFSEETGEKATLQGDSTVLTTLPAIKFSNLSFVEVKSLHSEIRCWEELALVKDSIITLDQSLLAMKDGRILTLTNEYYQSQTATKNLQKQHKKEVFRKTFIGVSAGLMAGFVVGVLTK